MKGPVNNQRPTLLVRTAVVNHALGNPSLGIWIQRRLPVRITSALSSESGDQIMVGGFDSRAEMPLTNTFVATKYDRLPIGVHDLKSAGCGFESHRLRLNHWGRSSNGRAA